VPRNRYHLIPLTRTVFSHLIGGIQTRHPEGARALSRCRFPRHSAHVEVMAFKHTGWHAAKILLLSELQVCEFCQPNLTFTLPAKFRIALVYVHTHCVCSHAPQSLHSC